MTDAEGGTAEGEATSEDKKAGGDKAEGDKAEGGKGPAPPLVIPAPYRARDAQPHLAFMLRYVCEVNLPPPPSHHRLKDVERHLRPTPCAPHTVTGAAARHHSRGTAQEA